MKRARLNKVYPCIYFDRHYKVKHIFKCKEFNAICYKNGKLDYSDMRLFEENGREWIDTSSPDYFPCGHNYDVCLELKCKKDECDTWCFCQERSWNKK